MNKLKVLVTGGGGFVGRNLTERLIKDGHEVTITATGSEPVENVHKVLYMSLEGIDWRYLAMQKFDVVFALPGFSLSWMIPNTDGPSYDKRSIKVHCAYGLKGGAAGYPHNIRNEIMDRVKNNFSKETLFESIPTKQYFNFLKTVQISVVAPGHGETSHSAYHNLQAGVCLFHWSAEGHIGKPTTSLEDIKLLPNVDLIPEQDYVSFTMKNLDEKLRYLIDNPKIAEKIGKSGQAKFYKGIDLDASCEQMIKVLQK